MNEPTTVRTTVSLDKEVHELGEKITSIECRNSFSNTVEAALKAYGKAKGLRVQSDDEDADRAAYLAAGEQVGFKQGLAAVSRLTRRRKVAEKQTASR